ncbi:zinc knuckle CX2CX4HX4C containing protein [Tanacetum coccineum]
MERGFLSSNSKNKNKNGDNNDKQTLQVGDDLVQNVWTTKIKNIDGKFVGRKVVRGARAVISDGGDVDAGIAASANVHVKDSEISGNNDVNTWDTPFIKPVSSVSTQKKTIKIMELHNEEVVEGAAIAIPFVAVEEVRNKFANTLYGYFIRKRPAFMLVEKYVKNTWAKFGLECVVLRNGFFLFQFTTREGMERVLENGPWLVILVPLILNIWSPNIILKKDEITLAPVWVKLHNVPIVAYSETGLTAKALSNSLVMAIPLPEGKGHTLETINIEVEVTKLTDTIKPSTKPSTSVDNEDGLVEVKNRKNKGKNDNSSRAIGGIRLSKPKSNFYWQQKKSEGSKSGANVASTSGTTKEGDKRKVPSPSRDKSDLTTPVSNPFNVLNTVEKNACDPSGQDPKKASISKSQDQEEASDDESEVEEYPPYDSTGIYSTGGGFSLEDDDLDCYDGYEAHVYNLSGKSQAFCDNYDIRLNSRVRK